MARSKYQAYDTETINRSDIKNAPYNPRIMDPKAKKRLKQNIAKHGLVAAPYVEQADRKPCRRASEVRAA